MLTENLKKALMQDIRDFLYNGSQTRSGYGRPVSTFIKTGFEKKFYEVGLYNPLLHYFEENGIPLLGYGKIAMIDHTIGDGLIKPMKNNVKYYLYNKGHILAQNYNVKFYYSDLTSLIFSLGLLEYVVKERITSDNLVSKLTEKGALSERLGLQDPRRRQESQTFGCDRRDGGQDGQPKHVCSRVQIYTDEKDQLGNDVHASGAAPDNESLQAG